MTKASFKILAAATVSMAVLAIAVPAIAGFEMRGSAPTPPPLPAGAPADLQGLEPVSAAPDMPAVKTEKVETAPVDTRASVKTPVIVAPPAQKISVASIPAPASNPADIVIGFGTDLPLALALPQITPAGYQYSFATGVDTGTRLSWDGGKPWKTVLADALRPAGLGFDVEGNTVRIVKGSATAGMPEMPENRIKSADTGGVVPLTIRRVKPSALADKNTAVDTDVLTPPPAEDIAPVAAPPVAADIVAPPVAASSSAPVALTSATIAADNDVGGEKLSAAESLTAAENAPRVAEAGEPAAIAAPVPAQIPAEMTVAPVTPVASAAPQTQMPQGAVWQANRGETLRDVLGHWSKVAGVDLYWSIDYDYKVAKDMAFSGDFDEATARLLEQFAAARPQPYGQLHDSARGPKVLIIKSYDLVD